MNAAAGTDHMQRKRRWVAALGVLACAAALASPAGAEAVDPRVLLTQYKCYVCHADRQAKAGPAYEDVAAYFRGKPDAVAIIAGKIRHGMRSGGPWHMPPHPEVSPAEARAMARYIMSLEPAHRSGAPAPSVSLPPSTAADRCGRPA
jgi:cytochrome c